MWTLGQIKSDNINEMITVAGEFYLVTISDWKVADNINQWSH